MPEEAALHILAAADRANIRVVGVLPMLPLRHVPGNLRKVISRGDVELGRLFTAKTHWLAVDRHGRHRGLTALLALACDSEWWRMVGAKAEREGEMEFMRCHIVYAMIELRTAPASTLMAIAESLQLEERHLRLLHPQSGRSLLHKPWPMDQLQFLLGSGLQEFLNLPDSSGLTPLDFWLARTVGSHDTEALALLLHSGAVPDHPDSSKRCSAVQVANDPPSLELVLAFGADVTRRNGEKHCLYYWPRLEPELVEKIIALGFPTASITGKLLYEGFACEDRFSQGLARTVDILLANGADVHYKGSLPLITRAPADLTERLIREGIEINGTPSLLFEVADDPTRWSPLLFSEHACRVPSTVQAFDRFLECSPLAKAAKYGNASLVEALLDYGVDSGKDQGEIAPLILAVCYDEPEVVRLLLHYGAAVPPLSAVAFVERGTPERLRYERFLQELVGRNTKRA